jgi:hypothetical protein
MTHILYEIELSTSYLCELRKEMSLLVVGQMYRYSGSVHPVTKSCIY